jgi:hypothetical protein
VPVTGIAVLFCRENGRNIQRNQPKKLVTSYEPKASPTFAASIRLEQRFKVGYAQMVDQVSWLRVDYARA